MNQPGVNSANNGANRAAQPKPAVQKNEQLTQLLLTLLLRQADRWRVWERWPGVFRAVHLRMTALHRAERAWERTKMWTAELVLQLGAIAAATGLLSLFGGSAWSAGWLMLPLVALFRYRRLAVEIRDRQRQMVLELPELLCKLVLLLNAGETLHQAIFRTAADISETDTHPLRMEWVRLSRSLRDQKPLVWAVEEFSRSCGSVEVSMFSTSVLLHAKRGGSDFVTALQELSASLWERRKAAARTMGEEAASKLVVPMVILFAVVMIVVAAPAVLLMNS